MQALFWTLGLPQPRSSVLPPVFPVATAEPDLPFRYRGAAYRRSDLPVGRPVRPVRLIYRGVVHRPVRRMHVAAPIPGSRIYRGVAH